MPNWTKKVSFGVIWMGRNAPFLDPLTPFLDPFGIELDTDSFLKRK